MTQPKAKLQTTMGWVEDFSGGTVKAIGALEVLAAIGLILPWWTGIAPVLTPLAALGLAAIMVGAVITHVRRKEIPFARPSSRRRSCLRRSPLDRRHRPVLPPVRIRAIMRLTALIARS